MNEMLLSLLSNDDDASNIIYSDRQKHRSRVSFYVTTTDKIKNYYKVSRYKNAIFILNKHEKIVITVENSVIQTKYGDMVY